MTNFKATFWSARNLSKLLIKVVLTIPSDPAGNSPSFSCRNLQSPRREFCCRTSATPRNLLSARRLSGRFASSFPYRSSRSPGGVLGWRIRRLGLLLVGEEDGVKISHRWRSSHQLIGVCCRKPRACFLHRFLHFPPNIRAFFHYQPNVASLHDHREPSRQSSRFP